jgi:hypothetical protein
LIWAGFVSDAATIHAQFGDAGRVLGFPVAGRSTLELDDRGASGD